MTPPGFRALGLLKGLRRKLRYSPRLNHTMRSSPSPSPYTSRLPEGEIRLISFPAINDQGGKDDRISCQLNQYSLNKTPAPSFDALSYCWGDAAVRKPVLVNGVPWTVTEQLDDALRVLRRSFPGRKIWADALCINQKDNDEKNAQVPLMSSIYRDAEHVYIWLGPSNEILDEFVSYMRNRGQNEQEPGNKSRMLVFNLALLSLPWWTRTWTFQEFILARSRIFLLGDYIIPYSEMRSWIHWLEADIDAQIQGTASLLSDPYYVEDTIETYGDRVEEMIHKWLPGCFLVGHAFSYAAENAQQMTLLDLLLTTAGRELSDPRDRIYALHSLLTNEERTKIRIDYNETKWQVYHRVVLTMWPIWRERYFSLLYQHRPHIGNEQSISESPSWVLDLSTHWNQFPTLVRYMVTGTPWLADQPSLELSSDGFVLSISATHFCDIGFVQAFSAHIEVSLEEYCDQVKRIMAAISAARSQEFGSKTRLASIDRLRTSELPFELFFFDTKPTGQSEINNLAQTLNVPLSRVRSLCLEVEREIARRSAAELARLVSAVPESVSGGIEESLRTILYEMFVWRRGVFFFVTKEGFYGFSQMPVAENDRIVLPRGGEMFLALRPVNRAEETMGKQQYTLVGATYVAGLMDLEELAEMMDDEAKKEEVFQVI